MKTYVLVASADSTADSEVVAHLTGKRFRNIPAMREAVEQVLGPFGTNQWEFYPADYFCEKWNCTNINSKDGIPSPDEAYIAIVEVEHDE